MKPTLVREQTLTYRTVTSSIKCLTRILCRIDGAQLEQVPGQGPLIIVINHVNFLEAPIFYTHLDPRPLTGFVKAEQLEHPIFGPLLIDLWGGIPIRRGEADVTAFRQAFEALEEGQILAVAPEGTRSGHGRLQQGHPGTALLALRSGAPVLPIVCYGGEIFWNNLRRLRRTDFHAVVGQSFYLDASGDRVTRQVRQESAFAGKNGRNLSNFAANVTFRDLRGLQKRLKPLLRTPISSAFIVAYPKMWAF